MYIRFVPVICIQTPVFCEEPRRYHCTRLNCRFLLVPRWVRSGSPQTLLYHKEGVVVEKRHRVVLALYPLLARRCATQITCVIYHVGEKRLDPSPLCYRDSMCQRLDPSVAKQVIYETIVRGQSRPQGGAKTLGLFLYFVRHANHESTNPSTTRPRVFSFAAAGFGRCLENHGADIIAETQAPDQPIGCSGGQHGARFDGA